MFFAFHTQVHGRSQLSLDMTLSVALAGGYPISRSVAQRR